MIGILYVYVWSKYFTVSGFEMFTRIYEVEFHEIEERKENFMSKILNLVNMRDLHFQVQFSQISCKKKVTVCEVLHCKSS